MTEQLSEPTEENGAKFDYYGNEKLLEEHLRGVMDLGEAMSEHRFTTPEAMQEAVRSSAMMIRSEVETISGAGNILLNVRGEDVMLANVEHTQSKPGVISFDFHPEKPYVSLSKWESRKMLYVGTSVEAMRLEDGTYQLHRCIVGADQTNRVEWKTEDGPYNIPWAQWQMLKRIIIPCESKNVEIESDTLERVRRRSRAMEALGQNAHKLTGLVAQINSLHQALFVKDREKLQREHDFKNVQLLRRLGKYGGRYAEQGTKEADLLSNAIVATLGVGRQIVIDGLAYQVQNDRVVTEEKESFYGHVVDVVADMPAANIDTGPSLVMSPEKPGPNNTLTYVPLTGLKAFRF